MRFSIVALSALMAFLVSPANAQSAAVGKLAEKAKPMSAGEVADLYNGKTWVWPDGAGYFRSDRRFYAWSGSGSAATHAAGKWLATKNGQLCFDATWQHSTGSSSRRDCFSHRKHGAIIYQRKDPSGNWYVFRSSPEKAADEYRKLQKGDQVTPNLKKVSANVRNAQKVAEVQRERALQRRAQERDSQSSLKEDYALFKAGRYREVLANLNERAMNGRESRDASLLRGWTLFKLMQYNKAREQFTILDRQQSTSETQHGLFYSGVALNPRYLGGW